jgi:superfamily I DNA and/or RNA helicase
VNKAVANGMDVSLFRLLSEARPETTVQLRYQYRMNQDIMMLSNVLIYHGKLVCGSQQVMHQSFQLQNLEHIVGDMADCGENCGLKDWLLAVLHQK